MRLGLPLHWLARLGLAGLLALTGLAADRPAFSHSRHLALDLTCLTCHAGAATSTKIDDNLLPAQSVCLPCHEAESISIKAPAPSRLNRFPHQKHVNLGAIAPILLAAVRSSAYLSPPGDLAEQLKAASDSCTACHRGLRTSQAVSRAHFPQMADCLVCHSKIEPPFSCEFCHTPGADLKPASHTPDYLDTHNSGKVKFDKTTCAVCHGRRFTCLGCH